MNNQILRKEKHQQKKQQTKMFPVLWSPKQLNNKKKTIKSCVTEPLKAVMKTRQMLRDALHTALSQKTRAATWMLEMHGQVSPLWKHMENHLGHTHVHAQNPLIHRNCWHAESCTCHRSLSHMCKDQAGLKKRGTERVANRWPAETVGNK